MVLLTGPQNTAVTAAPEPGGEQEQPAREFLVPRAPPNTPVAPAQHQEAARRVSF